MKLQAKFYEKLEKELRPINIIPFMERKLRKTYAQYLNPLPVVAWEDTFAVIRRLGEHYAMVAVKTWADSWATSARFHDEACLHCVLGCPGRPDHIAHYVNCDCLWVQVDEAMGYDSVDSIGERLLLESPTAERAKTLAVAFSTYHAVKLGNAEAVQWAAKNKDYSRVLNLAFEAAKAHVIKNARRAPARVLRNADGFCRRLVITHMSRLI
jgi:hypothetical protein